MLGIPNDNVKDYIASAAHKLQEGNWKACYDLIEKMRVWRLNSEGKQEILSMLKEKIKEAGLLSYIYMSQENYDSYNISTLSQVFELDAPTIIKVLSKVSPLPDNHRT